MAYGVIFDMDGVIINNNDWHLKSWLLYAQKIDMQLTAEEFPEKVFGKTNEQILAVAFPDADADQLEAWSLEKEALYREMYAPDFELAAGLLTFLEGLKQRKIPVAVASNAPLVNVDFALDLGNIRPYFDVVMYAGLVPNPKPAPDIYIRSAELLGLPTNVCFVIEDSPTGLEAANRAGCRSLAITSTFPTEKLKPISEKVFDNFNQIGKFMFG